MPVADPREAYGPRSVPSLLGLGILIALCIAGLLTLGTWQVERRSWKLDLIARVDARVHAVPSPAPGPPAWPDVTVKADEYRHVSLTGRFLDTDDTLVQAVTDYGSGYWDLVPFRTDAGWIVLVNRGFVPSEWRDAARPATSRADAETTLSGLLRVTEPGGGFLRKNDAAGDRWYSRDVEAIAARRGLGAVAPYFVDADGPPRPGRYPIGGLTVVTFRNNHLVYALTWYGLAMMLTGAAVWVARDEWRKRRCPSGGSSIAGRSG